jgi:hypothetical protein
MASFNLRVENAGNTCCDNNTLDVFFMRLSRIEQAESTFNSKFDNISYRVFSIEYYWGSNMSDSFDLYIRKEFINNILHHLVVVANKYSTFNSTIESAFLGKITRLVDLEFSSPILAVQKFLQSFSVGGSWRCQQQRIQLV